MILFKPHSSSSSSQFPSLHPATARSARCSLRGWRSAPSLGSPAAPPPAWPPPVAAAAPGGWYLNHQEVVDRYFFWLWLMIDMNHQEVLIDDIDVNYLLNGWLIPARNWTGIWKEKEWTKWENKPKRIRKLTKTTKVAKPMASALTFSHIFPHFPATSCAPSWDPRVPSPNSRQFPVAMVPWCPVVRWRRNNIGMTGNIWDWISAHERYDMHNFWQNISHELQNVGQCHVEWLAISLFEVRYF